MNETPKKPVPDRMPRHQSIMQMGQEFATKMEQPLNQAWPYSSANLSRKHQSKRLEDLRWSMVQEEFNECWDESCEGNSSEAMLKELADLVYVSFGYSATYGWDLGEAVRRVHLANMSKLGVDGKPLKTPDGKVLKGPNYKKCNLEDLV